MSLRLSFQPLISASIRYFSSGARPTRFNAASKGPAVANQDSPLPRSSPTLPSGPSSWWYPTPSTLPAATVSLLTSYSRLPATSVLAHVESLRSRAFDVFPYPCIGQCRFLNLTLSKHPLYPEILERLKYKPNEKLLDIGSCLGQDIRKLVADGAPAEKITGLDRDVRFVELGFEMWRDGGNEGLRSAWCLADLMAGAGEEDAMLLDGPARESGNFSYLHDKPVSSKGSDGDAANARYISLESLRNQRETSIVVANSFFHLYNLVEQRLLAKRIVSLLRPGPGTLILGRQIASIRPGEYKSINENEDAKRYAHDVESWKRMWDEVAYDVNAQRELDNKNNMGNGGVGYTWKFEVEATLDEVELGLNKNQGQNWADEGIRRMLFGVRSVS